MSRYRTTRTRYEAAFVILWGYISRDSNFWTFFSFSSCCCIKCRVSVAVEASRSTWIGTACFVLACLFKSVLFVKRLLHPYRVQENGRSPVWMRLCRTQELLSRYRFWQPVQSQTYGFSTLWPWMRLWRFRHALLSSFWWQPSKLQLKACSCSCTTRCWTSSHFCLYDLLQPGEWQTKGLSPVCARKCMINALRQKKAFLHPRQKQGCGKPRVCAQICLSRSFL